VDDSIHHIPASIDFYQEGDLRGLSIEDLGQYLTEKTRISFRIHENIYEGLSEESMQAVAEEFSKIKVKDPGKRFALGVPLHGEIDYEKRRIGDPHWKIFGNLYEGILYQKIIFNLVEKGALSFNRCAVLFTNQLFGTWDRDDLRYHSRASLYGFPHLISTSGIVEAPAKPKEFYFKKQMGFPVELLKKEYEGRFMDHGDSRMTEVLKGYVMQALFFHVSGVPFCEDPDCRLFNSHWQEELLHSQLDGHYEFCPTHEAMLQQLRDHSHI
jgi:hypothetical protein